MFMPTRNKIISINFFNYDLGCGEIRPVYTAHLETLLPAWRQHLQKENNLLEENFDIDATEN